LLEIFCVALSFGIDWQMLTIRNVRLLLPDRMIPNGWIVVNGDSVVEIGQGQPPSRSTEEFDGNNQYLSPGFIDLHVHGGNGEDFLDTDEEGFLKITDFHLSGGTTALTPTLATGKYSGYATALEHWDKARLRSRSRLLPLHLEGPHLAKNKSGAQDPNLMIPPTQSEIDWVILNASKISQITIAPELPGALDMIRSGIKAGIVFSAGHTEAMDEEMNAATTIGLNKVTHLYNAMSSAAKRGLFRQAGTLEFAMADPDIFCEIIGDGVHVTPTLFRLAYRAKGPGRIALITDALAGTGLPVGTSFRLGLLDCKIAEGYCVLADGSALAGSTSRMIDVVKTVATRMEVSLIDTIRMASLTPAMILNKDDQIGSIGVGKKADLILFDDRFNIHHVWVNGGNILLQGLKAQGSRLN
jgi:N-acetylglucosamine-6-phosphate deacetylase